MGTCCASCLPTKVRDYASNAENGAVTVTLIKNPPEPSMDGILTSLPCLREHLNWLRSLPRCDICGNRAEFTVSFFSRTAVYA